MNPYSELATILRANKKVAGKEIGIEIITKIGVNNKNHEGIGLCLISFKKNIDACQKSLL